MEDKVPGPYNGARGDFAVLIVGCPSLALLLLATGCGQRATEPQVPLAVTLTHVGEAGPDQAQFRLVNVGEQTVDYLASASTVPVLVYNAEKTLDEAGCVKAPDIPPFSAYPLMRDETLKFEYMDPKKVQVFGVFVRAHGSECWQMALARRSQ